jgi:hypothetical protein
LIRIFCSILCALALVLGALTLLSGRVVLAAWPRGGTSTIHPARDWASLLFLALPWTGFALLARQMRRHERGHQQPGETVGDTVRALLDENATARAGLRVTAGLLAGGSSAERQRRKTISDAASSRGGMKGQ